MCKLVCLEAPHSAEQVFIDSYFVSEMRVLADDQIFELVNSTAANTVFYDAKNTPWAKFRLINSGFRRTELPWRNARQPGTILDRLDVRH